MASLCANETQLAIHELTHVYQMESLYNGFTKAMSFVFGEQFIGIAASLLPMWFMEGDAVFAESILTESGRGRTPAFQKQLKAIAVENGKMYNYDKILNGSFRNFIPDYYQSGYQMITWSMIKYDHQLWNKVLKFTADEPFTINPVNISLRRYSGLTKKRLFNETFDSLETIWAKDVINAKSVKYDELSPSKKGKFINYYSPVYAGHDSIIAIKTSLNVLPQFVLISPEDKTEKKLHSPGSMYPWLISYARNKIVWVETEYDPRWENRDYSVIKVMDIRDKVTTRLSHKSRYMSASVSPDGKKVAASENTIGNNNFLVLIDINNGSIIQKVSAPDNVYLQRPQWSPDGEKITVIYLTEAGEGIMSYSIEDSRWDTLIPAARNDLQSSYLRNDSLFYISSLSGTDNILLRTPGGSTSLLTSSRFGTTDLTLHGGNLIFSDYSSSGNSICYDKIKAVPGSNSELTTPETLPISRVEIEPKSESGTLTNTYNPEPYRKWLHLFKLHSWMPFYADIEQIKSDPTAIRPGVSILSQNELGTLISSVGYEYSSEKKNVFHSRVSWRGWIPVIESQLDYGNNPGISTLHESVEKPSVIKPGIRFTNSVYVPLSFASGRFSEYLRPTITSEYRNDYIYLKEEGSYDYGQTIISGRLYLFEFHEKCLS